MRIEPKRIEDLGPASRQALMKRSTEDISSIYEHVRRIVEDVRERGDLPLLETNREFKEDVSKKDLRVTPREMETAYQEVDPGVVDCLRRAAANIAKFHEAQKEREMWANLTKYLNTGDECYNPFRCYDYSRYGPQRQQQTHSVIQWILVGALTAVSLAGGAWVLRRFSRLKKER